VGIPRVDLAVRDIQGHPVTRTRISRKDPRWVMECDREKCTTRSEPFDTQPDLSIFANRGWFVAASYGDRCPECVGLGLLSETAQPSQVMKRPRRAEIKGEQQ